MEPTQEQWRPVAGWEGYYEVSDLGRVRSLPRVAVVRANGQKRRLPGKVLKPWLIARAYPAVSLRLDGVCQKRTVHSLVAVAFLGPRPSGLEVCHGNGDPADNRLQNLRYATHVENSADMKLHGTDHEFMTHCRKNHEFTPENTRYCVTPAGRRYRRCRACKRADDRKSRERKRALRDGQPGSDSPSAGAGFDQRHWPGRSV